MKVCQSWFFTLPNSSFFVNIFFMFEENSVGNLILRMTYFTTLRSCCVNNHGMLFQSTPLIFESIIFFITWLSSWMSLEILTFFLCRSFHLRFSTTFLLCFSWYALYQTNELFVGAHSRETYWIVWGSFTFLMDVNQCLHDDLHETLIKLQQ